MCVRRSSLQLDGYGREQQNLDGSTRSVPERPRNTCKELAVILKPYFFTRHTISISDRSTLQQRSRPCPRRNDRTSHKTRLDRPSSRGKHFRSLLFIVVSFEHPCCDNLHFISPMFNRSLTTTTYHAKSKQEPNTEHNAISPSLSQGRRSRPNRSTTTSHDVLKSRYVSA
jgi:hypothetical protein